MKQNKRDGGPLNPLRMGLLLCALGTATAASATSIESENPDVRMNWDNTFKYNAQWRMDNPDPVIARNPGFAIGDASFGKNDLVLSRVDWLTEFDWVYQGKYGVSLSAAAWYDDAFKDQVKNPIGVLGFDSRLPGVRSYPRITRRFQRSSGEFLNAFAFANDTIGDTSYNFKIGQFATLWGDAYFSAANSLGFAQAPTDNLKATLVPGASAKELTLPTPSMSLTLQPSPEIAYSLFYQFKWDPDRNVQGGTYYGIADLLFEGSVALLPPTTDFGHKNGSWGLKAAWTPEWLNGTLTFVYREFSATSPQVLLDARFRPITAYANDIKLFGVGLNTTVDLFGVAWATSFELSQRRNDPLAAQGFGLTTPVVIPGFVNYQATTDGPRGTTDHLAISTVALMKNTMGFDSNSVVLELDWNHLEDVTRNPDLFVGQGYTRNINLLGLGTNCSTNATARGCANKDSISFYFNTEPTWFQVLPGWDFSIPFFYTRTWGNSPNGNANDGFEVYNVGARMVYHSRHRLTLAYTGYNATKTYVGGVAQYNEGAPYKDKATLGFTYEFTY